MFQASEEFSNPCLKTHILTVLRSMQARKKVSSASSLDTAEKEGETSFSKENLYAPTELFGIIADCENQKSPGQVLLQKAKNLCWSLLAIIASCFPDVSPLSCLTVWLEITAARSPIITYFFFFFFLMDNHIFIHHGLIMLSCLQILTYFYYSILFFISFPGRLQPSRLITLLPRLQIMLVQQLKQLIPFQQVLEPLQFIITEEIQNVGGSWIPCL